MAQDFETAFREALAQIDADARAAGSSLTAVCREAGISRTTPDRWRAKTPETVRIVTKMQEVVARKQAEAVARNQPTSE